MSSNEYAFQEIPDTQKIHEAIIFAARAHHGQYRKGTDIDYISHPLEVAQILTAMKASSDVILAGILHDVAEDTNQTLEDIKDLFGENVVEILKGHTQIKNASWEERKSDLIYKAQSGSCEVKMLVLADKVSNLRSLASDLFKDGEKIWQKFTVSKEKECWYYTEMAKAVVSIKMMPGVTAIYEEMEQLLKQVFLL